MFQFLLLWKIASYEWLAFARSKAGREVGPLNWTQEHSTHQRPTRRQARARLARAAVVTPASAQASSRTRRPFCRPALVARADFLKMGHFAPFYQFLHIKGRNFSDVFYPFTSTYDPYEPWKVSWKSVHMCLRNPEEIQTDRRGSFIYIEVPL